MATTSTADHGEGEWGWNAILCVKVKLKQAEVVLVRFRFTMASFKVARNLLTVALCNDLISEGKYLLSTI